MTPSRHLETIHGRNEAFRARGTGRENPAASRFGNEMLRRGAHRRESVQGPPDVGFRRVLMSKSDLSGDPPRDRPSPLG